MSTKATLVVLCAICAVLGLMRSDFVLGTGVGKRRVNVTFWNGFTGPDGPVMLGIIREFNKVNPDVQVSMQRMEWATYYNKLLVACLDNRGPEMFVIHASTLPRMVRAGFVAPATDLFQGADRIPVDDYDPYVLDQARFGKDFMGVPLDIHPQGMYCNLDMLKKAGIDHPPTNRDEFMQDIRAMTVDEDHDGHPDDWGYALSMWQNNFQSLLPQFGGHYLDDKGRADLACPGNVKALQFLGDLAQKYKLVPPPENALGWVGFRQKKVGIVFDGVYMLGDLLRLNDLKYVGAPIPTIGDHPGTMADSHVLCIRENLTPEQREGVERFIRYLSAHSIEWAAAGQVPARKSIRANPAFAKMQVQSAFAKQIPYMRYPPRTIALFELSTEIGLAVEKVVRGRATPEEALKVANENTQAAMDREAANP